MTQTPKILVDEIKIPIKDVLSLSTQDGIKEIKQKKIHNQAKDEPVVIFKGSEVIVIATVAKLFGQLLPRSWMSGTLGEQLRSVSLPPRVTSRTKVAELDFFIQSIPDHEWLLVVDDETGYPVGILNRYKAMEYLPSKESVLASLDPSQLVRNPNLRLWGDPAIEHVYYYCSIEDRHFGPHAVHPDAQGQMRDRSGHLVEVKQPD